MIEIFLASLGIAGGVSLIKIFFETHDAKTNRIVVMIASFLFTVLVIFMMYMIYKEHMPEMSDTAFSQGYSQLI